MPFLRSKVNCPVSPRQEIRLKELLGEAVGLIPGKSEESLLLDFEDRCRLWLRGKNSEPAAYIEAAVFASESHAGYPAFSARVAQIYEEVLGIPPENLYIRYEDIPAFSTAGQYIDRRMFR